MKKWILFMCALMMFGCAADVVVTSGVVAEGKKKEMEAAQEQKEEILNGMQKGIQDAEERKKEMEKMSEQ